MELCTSLICHYYRSLPSRSIFTTRECLKFGLTRGHVDQTLYKLVKTGEIIRLAREVFTCAFNGYPNPTDEELAEIKARAFGKTILHHCADEAARLGLPVLANIESTFIISGCSSSFKRWQQNVRIVFRTASAKKMRLQNTNAGKVVRALWHLGEFGLTQNAFVTGASTLTRDDLLTVLLSSAWMPWWLSDTFKEGNFRNYQLKRS